MSRQGYRKRAKKEVRSESIMPEPGTQSYENMIDFMRADLESGMGYSKIIETARKKIEAEGKDFDEEFEKWKQQKG